MHPEAHQGFGWALDQTGIDRDHSWRILDVGGQNINGTVHDYFPNATITTLDLEHADLCADAATWVPDRLFDVVIATELFEHTPEWRAIIGVMRSALDPEGPGVLLTTCASTNRQAHGATGAPDPAPGEWYENIPADALGAVLLHHFGKAQVHYRYPPGDAYAWALAVDRADVTVVIPSIPPRTDMRTRALASVRAQTYAPKQWVVMLDDNREGPAVIRNRIIEDVDTEWIAFLDDDDELLPHHIDTLLTAATETGADVVWPWFTVVGGSDPFPMHKGRQWNPDDPHQIPVTALVRTAAFRAVGGFRRIEEGPTDKHGNRAGEDFDLWLRLSAAGYRFHHVDEVTWTWHHHGRNSSGLPSRW